MADEREAARDRDERTQCREGGTAVKVPEKEVEGREG
jgi:hypothetical protein